MARSGRRLVIGAAGPLTTDTSLEAPAGRGIRRGEVRGYTTPTEDVSRREQQDIEDRSATPRGGAGAGDSPIIIVSSGAGGGADAGGNAAPGGGEVTTGEAGPGAGPGSAPGAGESGPSGGDAGDGGGGGDFKRGGIVTDQQPGKEHITAQAGEY